MKLPRYTDLFRGRYRTASESRQPGYLARRMQAYARLERLRATREPKPVTNVAPLRRRG